MTKTSPPMCVKNWSTFQHYRDTRTGGPPPWIKLYRKLLDDPQWFALSGDDAKLLIGIWLVVAETEGQLPDTTTLAFRLRVPEKDVDRALQRLKDAWLYDPNGQNPELNASSLLADCYNRREEEEKKRDNKVKIWTPSGSGSGSNSDQPVKAKGPTRAELKTEFEAWWLIWPRKVKKSYSFERYVLARKMASADVLLAGARRAVKEFAGRKPQYIPHPSTWLNQKCYLDSEETNSSTETVAILPEHEELYKGAL